MKMYSTMHPGALLADANALLRLEGYLASELPESWIHDYKYQTRGIQMGGGATCSTYWATDFALYTDADDMIRSPYRPAHKALQGDPDVYAATWTQWGLVLGAMFDITHRANEVHDLRFTNTYDPVGKHGGAYPDGRSFETSAEKFHYKTCGQFSSEVRRRQSTPPLTCTVHRWAAPTRRALPNEQSISRCTKCDTLIRF